MASLGARENDGITNIFENCRRQQRHAGETIRLAATLLNINIYEFTFCNGFSIWCLLYFFVDYSTRGQYRSLNTFLCHCKESKLIGRKDFNGIAWSSVVRMPFYDRETTTKVSGSIENGPFYCRFHVLCFGEKREKNLLRKCQRVCGSKQRQKKRCRKFGIVSPKV